MTENTNSQYQDYLDKLYKKYPPKQENDIIKTDQINVEEKKSDSSDSGSESSFFESEKVSEASDSEDEDVAPIPVKIEEKITKQPEKKKQSTKKKHSKKEIVQPTKEIVVPKVSKSKKVKKVWNDATMVLTEVSVPMRIKRSKVDTEVDKNGKKLKKNKKKWMLCIRYSEKGFDRNRTKRFSLGEERLIDTLKQLQNQIRNQTGDPKQIIPEIQQCIRPFRSLKDSDNLLSVKFWKQELLNTPLKMEEAFIQTWRKLRKSGKLVDWQDYE